MSQIRAELQDQVLNTNLQKSRITVCRNQIRKEILRNSGNIDNANFAKIGSGDLRILMESYDHHFFDGLCYELIEENRDHLSFRISTRMTSAGGKTIVESKGSRQNGNRFPPRDFEIVVSATLLFQSFTGSGNDQYLNDRLAMQSDLPQKKRQRMPASSKQLKRKIRVGGVECADRLDALQRIFEHELVHLIEFLIWNDSSCSAKRFKSIIWRFFGHEQSNHQLTTPSESAEFDQGIGVGDFVTFRHAGHKYFGYVNHINRRATVLVPNKKGDRYTDGKNYVKFYVPIGKLKRNSEKI